MLAYLVGVPRCFSEDVWKGLRFESEAEAEGQGEGGSQTIPMAEVGGSGVGSSGSALLSRLRARSIGRASTV